MAHSGQYFQQVLTTSSHFVLYNSVFSGKLERLYEIQYSEKITKRLAVGTWKGGYYHCTGHCECLETRLRSDLKDDQTAIHSHHWCNHDGCPIQGILRHGFLATFNKKTGHFISPDPSTAKKYGMLKCKKRKVVATFICYCRDVTKQSSVIRHVQRDEFNTAASADKMVANARPIDITPPPWRDTLDKYFHEIKE
ncbi:hypothetical protein EDD21DRAFT_429018 [Dissophora ornata]|nr:hypothetical protein EDD21DRAFT_429018 [Dissophora ornata]